MSKLDDKFISAVEEIKNCFVVAQAMAKNSFKTGVLNDNLQAENKRLRMALEIIEKRKTTISGAKQTATGALSKH